MAGATVVGFQLKMVPELQEVLQVVQEKLYRGYMCSKQSGIDWLNGICGDFYKLFRILHKFIVFEGCNNVGVMEITFLCLSQIVVCIRCLERALTVECKKQCVLSSTRQCFLDRIIWCIAKIKALAEDPGTAERESTMESNFVSFLDLALNLVEPLTVALESKHVINQAEQDAEAMMETAKIRSVVEALVAQTLAFGNVLHTKERTQLTAASQKVLKECISLEKESALQEGADKPNAQNRLLKASALESAIFNLETQVNDCLLRLVYETFAELSQNLIASMRKLVKEGASEEDISLATEKFDSLVDKMMQIGLFAISYADNYKAASTIRSCLASIEALDSYLVPSIFIPCNHHSKLLEEHWSDELSLLRYHVQMIIDSNAFALALIEILDNGIDSLCCSFNATEALTLVRQAEVFKEHLEINFFDLKLDEDPQKIHFEDYKMMVLECRAIVKCSMEDPTIDAERILKRFRIMVIKLRKIQQAISLGTAKDTPPQTNEVQLQIPDSAQTDEEKAVEQSVKDFFSSSIPRTSTASILYRSRRGQARSRQGSIASLMEMKSFSDVTAQLRQRAKTTPEKSAFGAAVAGSSRKKRNSLRIAIFKRQCSKQTAELFDSFKSDIDFQITEILDQLNDLSSTFSQTEHEESDLPTSNILEKEEIPASKRSATREEIAILDDNRIRINITTDI